MKPAIRIPAIRLSYRFSYNDKEYGSFCDLPADDTTKQYHETLNALLYFAEKQYELLEKLQEEHNRED